MERETTLAVDDARIEDAEAARARERVDARGIDLGSLWCIQRDGCTGGVLRGLRPYARAVDRMVEHNLMPRNALLAYARRPAGTDEPRR